MTNLTEGTLVHVSMTVRMPVDATERQFEEWIRHFATCDDAMPQTNPLAWVNVDAQQVQIKATVERDG